MASKKMCTLPGVDFGAKDFNWRATWTENHRKRERAFSVRVFMAQGMSEEEALLAAVRLAIEARNKQVTEFFAANRTNASMPLEEKKLRRFVRNKKCNLPGIMYREDRKRWGANWMEHGKQMFCYFPIREYQTKHVSECDASLAALRAAIDLRCRKVGPGPIKREALLIKVIPDAPASGKQ